VHSKYFNNATNFAPGFITPDDAWENRWRRGQNFVLGWGATPGRGNGAKTMGEELANSDAFAQCQVEKVFKAVCFRAPGAVDDPGNPNKANDDRLKVTELTNNFKANGYRLKQVFAETAVYCMGE
jgi:hypothetical protein